MILNPMMRREKDDGAAIENRLILCLFVFLLMR
jgi:hypothetical protein